MTKSEFTKAYEAKQIEIQNQINVEFEGVEMIDRQDELDAILDEAEAEGYTLCGDRGFIDRSDWQSIKAAFNTEISKSGNKVTMHQINAAADTVGVPFVVLQAVKKFFEVA